MGCGTITYLIMYRLHGGLLWESNLSALKCVEGMFCCKPFCSPLVLSNLVIHNVSIIALTWLCIVLKR